MKKYWSHGRELTEQELRSLFEGTLEIAKAHVASMESILNSGANLKDIEKYLESHDVIYISEKSSRE